MLPQEWPLARLSAQLRHVGVLLRVTLYRRLAELSFRGALSISCHVKLCGRYDETSMSFVEQPQVSWHLCLHSFGLSKQMTSSLTPQGWPCMRIQTSGCMGCCPLVPKRVRPKLWKQEVSRHFVQEMKMQLRRWSPTAMLFRLCKQW